ncbi:MAG: hypothetical protein ACRD3S_06295, partial [Terracidiphilus sp.]
MMSVSPKAMKALCNLQPTASTAAEAALVRSTGSPDADAHSYDRERTFPVAHLEGDRSWRSLLATAALALR